MTTPGRYDEHVMRVAEAFCLVLMCEPMLQTRRNGSKQRTDTYSDPSLLAIIFHLIPTVELVINFYVGYGVRWILVVEDVMAKNERCLTAAPDAVTTQRKEVWTTLIKWFYFGELFTFIIK
jgi:hypothetical protein